MLLVHARVRYTRVVTGRWLFTRPKRGFLRISSFLVAVAWGTFGSGCGAKASKQPASAPARTLAGPAEAPDLSPVAAPDDLVVVARLSNPARSLAALKSLVGAPLPDDLLFQEFVPGLDGIIDKTAPIDGVVMLDPLGEQGEYTTLMAVAFGLPSVGGAVRQIEQLGHAPEQIGPGLYYVQLEAGRQCAVAAAVGASPARLICASMTHELENLVPYLTRGLPRQTLSPQTADPTDLTITAYAAPFKSGLRRSLRQLKMVAGFALRQFELENEQFDRALSQAARGLLNEADNLVADLDRARFSLRFDKGRALADVRLELEVSGRDSFIVSQLLEHGQRATVPPPRYWDLPGDSLSAGYTVGTDPRAWADMMQTLTDLLEGYLTAQGVSETIRRKATAVLDQLTDYSGTTVYARLGCSNTDREACDVAGYKESPRRLLSLLEAISSVYNDPEFLRGVVGGDEQLRSALPGLRFRRPKSPGLPEAARVLELSIPKEFVSMLESEMEMDAADKSPEKEWLVAVAPGKNYTWVAFGNDDDSVVRALKRVIDAPKDTLREKQQLEEMAQIPAAAAGFLTLASFRDPVESALVLALGSDFDLPFDKLPHRGLTPIRYAVKSDGQSSVGVSLSVSQAVFEDLFGLLSVSLMGAAAGSPG